MRLRQDLERARLLCELIRKREKMKRELVAVTKEWWEMAHRPLARLLHSILDEISAKDTQSIFMDPVDEEEVPDYRSVVHNPMDISTMRANINAFTYSSVHDLFLHFKLMIDNCLLYNSKDTVSLSPPSLLSHNNASVTMYVCVLRCSTAQRFVSKNKADSSSAKQRE